MFGYIDINTEYSSGSRFMPAYPENHYSLRAFSDEANGVIEFIESESKSSSALSLTRRNAYLSF